jgi:hypothetical protein
MPRAMPLRACVPFAIALLLSYLWSSVPPAGAITLSPPASQPATKPASQPAPIQTGRFQLTFSEKSPLSNTAAIAKRMGWNLAALKALGSPIDYDIANESFEAYVPSAYTGTEPYGLLVWINAGPDGKIFDWYLDVIDRHKLIVIGPNNAGNKREIWNRMAVALDAAHNMRSRFNIDPRRVYVAGGSGGGRTSSQLGIAYPDVFRGGCYIIGCNYFRNVDVNPATHEIYSATFTKPVPVLFAMARDRSRHVLLTGETDMNRLQTKLNADAMAKDGFRHVTYLEQPGLGHSAPNAEWFEKGIVALDEPLATEPEAPATAASKSPPANGSASSKRSTAATTRPTTVAASKEPEDVKMLRLAKLYMQNRLYSKARAKLKELLATHAGTASVTEAQALLKEIGTTD